MRKAIWRKLNQKKRTLGVVEERLMLRQQYRYHKRMGREGSGANGGVGRRGKSRHR
jgi:hypothetical protein